MISMSSLQVKFDMLMTFLEVYIYIYIYIYIPYAMYINYQLCIYRSFMHRLCMYLVVTCFNYLPMDYV